MERCPFEAQSVRELKESTVGALKRHGLEFGRQDADRADLAIDYRNFDLLLRAGGDPETRTILFLPRTTLVGSASL